MKKILDSYRVLVLKSEVMMKFTKFYERGLVDKNKQNINEVKITAQELLNNQYKNNRWLLKKIKNHMERFGLSSDIEEFLNEVVSSDNLASMFAKPASKQNMSEILQKDFLSKRNIHIEKLPATGNNAVRLLNGELIYGDDRDSKATKSIDFNRNGELICAKVTTGRGGGQDNQYRDVRDFLKEANEYDVKYGDKKFTALVDGDYYTEEKLKTLKKFKTKNIRITSSDEF